MTSYCHLSSFFPLSTDSKRVLYLVAPGHHTGIWRYLVLCVLVWMVSGHTYRIVISIYRKGTDFLGRWSQFYQVIKEKGIKCQNSDLNPDLYQIIFHTILLSFNFFRINYKIPISNTIFSEFLDSPIAYKEKKNQPLDQQEIFLISSPIAGRSSV